MWKPEHRLAAGRSGLRCGGGQFETGTVCDGLSIGGRNMNCANACPKHLNPAKAIAKIKQMMVEPKV